ncbi:DapH/DapD/GlmU-related protein [Haladaptatus sp. T7]|uniref:xenobiotic acyltransferase family protein n=1 Tax=Haladaptatus sp. T7 TaxID=2029368 RepID=UPI0022327B4D|nr:DapH/DapD/GlmU-related protein [Haladaptatus sp. T7]
MNHSKLYSWGHTVLEYTTYSKYIRALLDLAPVETSIQAGENVDIGRGCKIQGDISLGDEVRIGSNTTLDGKVTIEDGTNLVDRNEVIGTVQIGKYCAIARRVTFQGRNHLMHNPGIQMRFYREKLDDRLEEVTNGPIVIGSDVWIGTESIILSDVEIGSGAVIGAGSIVTDDVEPYSVVAGVPAQHKKWRFPEHIREQLLEEKWWEWSEQKIQRNREFFQTDLRTVDDLQSLVR